MFEKICNAIGATFLAVAVVCIAALPFAVAYSL